MKKKNLIKNLIVFIILALVTLFYYMASEMNPWCVQIPHLDSSVFLRVAVGMHSGEIAYVDIFDHKGPILYAIEYLGLAITPHSLTGIWILELIFGFFNLVFLYFTANQISKSKLVSMISAILCLHPFYYFFAQGNTDEEWALPLISFSLFVFVRYLKTGYITKKLIYIVGICMGLSFLINGNLVGVWAAYATWILVYLIVKKKFKELVNDIVFFVLGFITTLGIVSLVLAAFGAFKAFWSIYLGFNSDYAGGGIWISRIQNMLSFSYTDVFFVIVFITMFIILFHEKTNLLDYRYSGIWFAFVTLLMVSMSGRGYEHYGIQLIPCLLIPVTVVLNKVYECCHGQKEFVMICALFLVLVLRYDYADYYNDCILWTMDETTDNYRAGGKAEYYRYVNEYLGGRWDEQDIIDWVVNDNSD